ncbi:hypothetical protein VS_1999 [Vibrio atlanticus]|uniref:Uncharacterized protein n=1 Tax=Vibrio atlanticus (strain LGP32) TaxID=575788 RepID=B7VGX6_VIBA3|nr:hypothetical protein VS_1999 [Vibrio atlanticus]
MYFSKLLKQHSRRLCINLLGIDENTLESSLEGKNRTTALPEVRQRWLTI